MLQRNRHVFQNRKSLQPLIEVVSGVLILLFLYTALSKLWEHGKFKAVLQVSPLLSPYATALSWIVPVTEVALVILLVSPVTRRVGFTCSAILLAVFTLYLVYMMLFTPDRPCSCGGVIEQLSWVGHIALNLVMMALAICCTQISRKMDRWARHVPP